MRPYFNEDEVFLGSFEKTVTCDLEETFSFERIAEAFDHDNHIDELDISGKQAGDFILTKKDIGRLNVSDLTIRSELSRGQQILENGALKGSEGSLQTLKVYNKNLERGGHVGLGYLKPVCSTLTAFIAHGVSIDYIDSEDLEGCTQLTYLKFDDSFISIIGEDKFKMLTNIREIHFHLFSKV